MDLVQARCDRGKGVCLGPLVIDEDLLSFGVRGRHVLLVDDIFDTGHTLWDLIPQIDELGPTSVRSAVLLQKEGPMRGGDEARFRGLHDSQRVRRGLRAGLPRPVPQPALPGRLGAERDLAKRAVSRFATMTQGRDLSQIIPTLDRAGAEKQLCLLAAGLPRDEFDVHVCALTRGGPLAARLAEAGIPLAVIGKRWKLDPQAFWRLKQHVARLQPDLIHAWMFAANTYGYAAARACGVKHFVVGQRCVDPWKSRLQLAVDRALARRCSRVVVNSEGVRDFYVQHGTPAERVRVIPNGVALPEPPATTRRQLLAELELPDDSRLIGLVGRLWPQKRVKDAIWAADLLKVIRDDVHLLVIGDGPQRDRLRRFRDQCRIARQGSFSRRARRRAAAAAALRRALVDQRLRGPIERDSRGDGGRRAGGGHRHPRHAGAGDSGRRPAIWCRWAIGRRLPSAHETTAERFRRWAAQFAAAARQRVQSEFSVEKMVQRHAELYREVLDVDNVRHRRRGLERREQSPGAGHAPADDRRAAPSRAGRRGDVCRRPAI